MVRRRLWILPKRTKQRPTRPEDKVKKIVSPDPAGPPARLPVVRTEKKEEASPECIEKNVRVLPPQEEMVKEMVAPSISDCDMAVARIFAEEEEEASSLTIKYAAEWASALLSGLVPYALGFDDTKEDEIKLFFPASGVVGEIATRSRLAMGWRTNESISLKRLFQDGSGTTRIQIQGLRIEPIEGAELAFQRLRIHWLQDNILSKDDPLSVPEPEAHRDLLESAWRWWRKEGYNLLIGTKYWRVVESLVGRQVIRSTAPITDLALVIVGAACGSSWQVTGLAISPAAHSFSLDTPSRKKSFTDTFLYSPKSSDQSRSPSSAPSAIAYSALEYEPIVISDEATQIHNFKIALSERMIRFSYASAVTVRLCRKFATSAFNFSLAWYDLSSLGLPRSDPQLLIKLFQAAEAMGLGGASSTDRALKGALYWQKDDITYRMTGNHGRVIWRLSSDPALISPSASSLSSSSSNSEQQYPHPPLTHTEAQAHSSNNNDNTATALPPSFPSNQSFAELNSEAAEPAFSVRKYDPPPASSKSWLDYIPVCHV